MGASCDSISCEPNIEEKTLSPAAGTGDGYRHNETGNTPSGNDTAGDDNTDDNDDSAQTGGAVSNRIAQSLGLYVIPVHRAIPHERFNKERVTTLLARLATEDRLVNPPVAVRHAEGDSARYIILDGATRVTAFQHLGYPHIIVQVVDLHTHRIRLDTWQHTLHGDTTDHLLAMLGKIEGLRITPMNAARLLGRTPVFPGIGFLLTPDGGGFLLEAQTTQPGSDWRAENGPHQDWPNEEWLAVFHQVVDRCGEWGRIERTLATDMDALRTRYPDIAGHFVFHGFQAEEVLQLAASGRAVPAGITRFVIPGRILRFNVPLDLLRTTESAATKQAWLDELLTEKIINRRMRYYEEPVILLDE